MDTQVTVNISPSTSTCWAIKRSSLLLTGILSGSRIGSPMSTRTDATSPSCKLSSSTFIPASVCTFTIVLSVKPLSYMYLPTQRIALPHISAGEPSRLNRCIRKSASDEGKINTNPSEPIPKCLSLSNFAIEEGFSIFSSKQFT